MEVVEQPAEPSITRKISQIFEESPPIFHQDGNLKGWIKDASNFIQAIEHNLGTKFLGKGNSKCVFEDAQNSEKVLCVLYKPQPLEYFTGNMHCNNMLSIIFPNNFVEIFPELIINEDNNVVGYYKQKIVGRSMNADEETLFHDVGYVLYKKFHYVPNAREIKYMLPANISYLVKDFFMFDEFWRKSQWMIADNGSVYYADEPYSLLCIISDLEGLQEFIDKFNEANLQKFQQILKVTYPDVDLRYKAEHRLKSAWENWHKYLNSLKANYANEI